MCRKNSPSRTAEEISIIQNMRSFNATPGSKQIDLVAQAEQPLQLLVTVIYRGRTLQGDHKITAKLGRFQLRSGELAKLPLERFHNPGPQRKMEN
jgi:hypothetical protein